jgi:thymidylate synthase (FAD)
MLIRNITVDYIDHMGNDDSIVNAARVSFHKTAENYTPEQNEKLIKFLATHNHWTPFAHTTIQLKVSAPIFVARQLFKHQTGGVINEVSRRYVSDEPTFFIPDGWRSKPINGIKQGSGDEIISGIDITDHLNNSLNLYNDLLDKKVAPELARMVLPQNMITEWYWTGSLYFWARVCKLRLDSHTQKESQIAAEQISEICSKLFPIAWRYLLPIHDQESFEETQ